MWLTNFRSVIHGGHGRLLANLVAPDIRKSVDKYAEGVTTEVRCSWSLRAPDWQWTVHAYARACAQDRHVTNGSDRVIVLRALLENTRQVVAAMLAPSGIVYEAAQLDRDLQDHGSCEALRLQDAQG